MRIHVKGMGDATEALNAELRKMPGVTKQMLTAMLMGVSAQTKPYVPVDTSFLINSEYRKPVSYTHLTLPTNREV